MEPPLYLYVRLDNFFQNHRRYVRSTSESQLHGKNVTRKHLASCQPFDTLGDTDAVISPCGLPAWSYFNDTLLSISVSESLGAPAVALPLDSSRLVWDTDRSGLFGDVPPQNHNTVPALRGGAALTKNINQDENFMAWMKTPVGPGAVPTCSSRYILCARRTCLEPDTALQYCARYIELYRALGQHALPYERFSPICSLSNKLIVPILTLKMGFSIPALCYLRFPDFSAIFAGRFSGRTVPSEESLRCLCAPHSALRRASGELHYNRGKVGSGSCGSCFSALLTPHLRV